VTARPEEHVADTRKSAAARTVFAEGAAFAAP
jgi:hypothetical protein